MRLEEIRFEGLFTDLPEVKEKRTGVDSGEMTLTLLKDKRNWIHCGN